MSGADNVIANLEAVVARMQKNAETAMAEVMVALEGWAKSEHAYTDDTGNLSQSIRGEVAEASAEIVRGVLSAGMSYGIFVELAHSGKWAFLLPTITRHQDDILKIIEARMSL